MAINSVSAEAIDNYITSHDCNKGHQKIIINGQVSDLPSYQIPIRLLQFNRDNRRFNVEIGEVEAKLGRQLNPTLDEDINRIKMLLLQDEIEAKKLKSDLKKIGQQTDVAVISWDGVVINGNRRMATLQELYDEEPNAKWESLWTIRLPEKISEQDLWRIEAGLQLSKIKVADYGPINNMLMVSEGKRAGLTNKEIAAAMYGWTEKKVDIELERLGLIEIFLQFLGQPKNFGLIKKFQLNEHFINIQNGIVKKMNDSGAPKRDLHKKLETVFVYLKASIDKPNLIKITHLNVRDICKILENEKASEALIDSFEETKDIRKIRVEKLVDNLDRAGDIHKNFEDKEKPGKLIDRAITALTGINRTSLHYKSDPDVKKKLLQLEAFVIELKTELGI